MINAFDASCQALEALASRQDIISNNLANANTAGYRQDVLLLKSFTSVFDSEMGRVKGGLTVDGTALSTRQGPITPTGNSLDIAIAGDGFFAVAAADGERYTRAGNFTLNEQGQIVTPSGEPVLGENGALECKGTEISVSKDGELIVDGTAVNRFKIVSFASPEKMVKSGGNLLAAPEGEQAGARPDSTTLIQGSEEASGVEVVREMVQMIDLLRSFEANQKMILARDGMLNKCVNSVGSSR